MEGKQRIPPFLTGDPAEQTRSHDAPVAGPGVVVLAPARAARRHHYRRRHTLHFYLVCSAVSCASVVVALNAVAYAGRSIELSTVAYIAVLVTTLVIFVAFFWGFYMVINGNIPAQRIRYLIPHAAVGVLSPLFYTLNVSVGLEDVGRAPVSGLALTSSSLCLAILLVQFGMGKLVVRPARLHLIRKNSADE